MIAPNPFAGEMKNPLASAKFIASNVPPEVYLRQEPGVARGDPRFVMQRTSLMSMADCAHKWVNGYERDDSDASDWGSGLDCLSLCPKQWSERFAVKPETYPAPAHHADVKKGLIKIGDPLPWNARASYCAEWQAKQGKRILFSEERHLQLQNAVKFLYGNPEARELLQCSQRQVMLLWVYVDPETKLTVNGKCLLDLVPDPNHPQLRNVLADLKTSTNASLHAWTNKVFEEDYDAQAALFLDAYNLAMGEGRVEFQHIVQESGPPWETIVWPLDLGFVELGRDKYKQALAYYCQCLKSNTWPSYNQGKRVWVQPKPWMIQEFVP